MATDIQSLILLGQQPLSNDGQIVPGGKLYFYAAGSSLSLQDTYSDANGTVNANPVILDGNGRCIVYGQQAPYHVVFKDANGVTIWDHPIVYAPLVGTSYVGNITINGLQLAELVDTAYAGSPAGVQTPYTLQVGSTPAYSVVVFNETADLSIGTIDYGGGVGNGAPYSFFWINKSDTYTVLWKHNYTANTAAILTDTSTDQLCGANSMGWAFYDLSTSRWRISSWTSYSHFNFVPNYLTGTWTSTPTATANCSSVVVSNAKYTRTGRLVTIEMNGTITVTNTATLTTFTVSLPSGLDGAAAPVSIGTGYYDAAVYNPLWVESGTTTATVRAPALAATTNGGGLAWLISLTYCT